MLLLDIITSDDIWPSCPSFFLGPRNDQLDGVLGDNDLPTDDGAHLDDDVEGPAVVESAAGLGRLLEDFCPC